MGKLKLTRLALESRKPFSVPGRTEEKMDENLKIF